MLNVDGGDGNGGSGRGKVEGSKLKVEDFNFNTGMGREKLSLSAGFCRNITGSAYLVQGICALIRFFCQMLMFSASTQKTLKVGGGCGFIGW